MADKQKRSIPLFKVNMNENTCSNLKPILASGYIGQGPQVDKFEELLQGYIGNPYCIAVNSGTSALHLALHMLKKPDTDRTEILTTPLTCTATNFPIRANGLNIKWVDVNPHTCNMDMTDLSRKISPKTLAIMVVHWGGRPCDLSELKKIQDECKNLYGFRPKIIEDCAHAFGAEFDGKILGNHGNFCMFSFQAIKHLTCGDGGLLISPNYEFHRRAKLLRWYGLDRERSPDMRCEQNVEEWGYKFHMNDINATIGISNFKDIKDIVTKHRMNGEYINEHLRGVKGVRLLENCTSDRKSAYWIFTLRVENRDGFVKNLKEAGISASRVHDRNDKHRCLSQYVASLPGTDEICKDMICIPCGWWVSEDDRQHIVDTIKKGW